MNALDILATVRNIFVGILIGRWSTFYIRNKQLDEVKEALIEEADRLEKLEEALTEQDQRIRDKWKAMVDDFSKYNAYAMRQAGKDTDKWSEWDDQYLRSWGSADE